jgi:enoyl-[acyl-carrier protein] reductase I
MSNGLLKGKKGIIFGALNNQSIAWKVAERAHEEGAQIILTNAPIAMRMGEIDELGKKTNAPIIPADATSVEELDNLVKKSMEHFGGKIDFILHSIGMSVNVRKGKHYTDQNYEYTMKGLDVSALSFHKVLQTAMKNDAMNDWGSILALTYIAAQRVFPDYNDMADNKSYLESVARSFGYHYGVAKKVRFINFSEKMSPLGNASALDCANYCITLFSDLTKYVTMQNLFHDGGFSNTGVTQQVIEKFGQ